MKYTAKQRKYIAMRFKEAKKNLWDGRNRMGYEFICHALNQYDKNADLRNFDAHHIIGERLDGEATVNSWLHRTAKIPQLLLTAQQVQAYRLRWLDELIREFST